MLLSGDTIVIDQGTTWSDSWLYEEGATDETIAPVDLSTGWIGRCQVRRRYDGTVLASWHSDPAEERDGAVLLGVDGTVTLILDADTSVPWTWFNVPNPVFDIELEHIASGRVVRITEGRATLRAEVTEDEEDAP